MDVLADSSANNDGNRILPQHEAVLTLIKARLEAQQESAVRWLDVACGPGVLLGFFEALPSDYRTRLYFEGFDAKYDYILETERIASGLGLGDCKVRLGSVSDFHRLFEPQRQFDFITVINALHEFNVEGLASALVESVIRLSAQGQLYVYDLESIDPPELGAIPWAAEEIDEIVKAMLQGFGVPGYSPRAHRVPHSSCKTWSLHIQRPGLPLSSSDLQQRRDDAIRELRQAALHQLKAKSKGIELQLEARTLKREAKADDRKMKRKAKADHVTCLLHDLWAVQRAGRQTE